MTSSWHASQHDSLQTHTQSCKKQKNEKNFGFSTSDVWGCCRHVLGAFWSSLPPFQISFTKPLGTELGKALCCYATRQHQSDAALVAKKVWICPAWWFDRVGRKQVEGGRPQCQLYVPKVHFYFDSEPFSLFSRTSPLQHTNRS